MEDNIIINESEEFICVPSGAQLRFHFPAVLFLKRGTTIIAYFNRLALPMLPVTTRICVKVSSNFIVFLPSESNRNNVLSRSSKYNAMLSTGNLNGMVQAGTAFRCYRYKGGIAIKRSEPIREDNHD